MNLRPALSPSSRLLRHEAGFTMVEIAISLGVIAFAIIAIIGILPTGLQGQRDNREETIVNQDARLLIEAIKSGGRDQNSDLGKFVVAVDGVAVGGTAPDLVQLLSDSVSHEIVMSALTGAVANRGNDLAFHYQVRNTVADAPEFQGTPMANQVHEVRLRFAWPVLPNNTLGAEPNRRVVRTLISGWKTNGVIFAQQFRQP